MNVGEDVVEPVEAVVPESFERFDPVVQFAYRGSVDRIDPLTTGNPDVDEVDCTQHGEMFGHLRLGETGPLDEVVHRRFTVGEDVEKLSARGLGNGIESV